MPIYEYFCEACAKKWESIHSVAERESEMCSCGETARLLMSAGAVRTDGITRQLPRLNRREVPRNQIYDANGNKKIDQAALKPSVDAVNAKIDKVNTARGYHD